MKTIFIPTQYEGKVNFSKIKIDKLPDKIGIITTAQFLNKSNEIIQYLKNNDKKVFFEKDKQKNKGQLLGCDQGSALKVQDKADVFLYIGSGEFHPLGVVMKTDKEVYSFNPITNIFERFNRKNIEKYKKNKKVRYMKFLSSDNIGILVSLKHGQVSYKKTVELKNNLEGKGKNCFIFVFNTLDTLEMENFPFIEFWANTACPRIADDKDKKSIIDISEIDI